MPKAPAKEFKPQNSKFKTYLPLHLVIVFIGGVLMGLTPAPAELWPLAWVALIPLWVLVVNRQDTLRGVLLLGLMWGIGYHGLALSWISGVHPMTWMGVPWLASLAIALFCWVFITLWGAVLVAIWAGGMAIATRVLSRSKLTSPLQVACARVLLGVALWSGLEAIWSFLPLYWSSLSYTQSPHNLVILHLGQISGPLTITAAIVAVNGFLAEAWSSRMAQAHAASHRQTSALRTAWGCVGVAASLLVGLHLIGLSLYSRPLPQASEAALKVGIIQGNVPNEIKLYPGGLTRALEGYTTGYRTLADQGVDAVLTPETALPFVWTQLNQVHSSFHQAILDRGVVAWLGTFGKQGQSLTNSLFAIAGNGEVASQYNKVKLVPLGEYIPFEQFLGRFIDRLSPLDAHLIAGQSGQHFDTPFGRAIAAICYESAFSEHFRAQATAGGQFILSASNDAHYSPAMPNQHHAQDVMRAIETDRWAVRATNTGYSGIVDAHGKTEWRSRLNTYELHAATIYRRSTQTPYVRWGDWLTPFLILAAAVTGGWTLRGERFDQS